VGAGYELLFFYGPEPLKIIDLYTELTGRPPLAIPWVFAPWNDAVKGEDKVYKRADDLRAYDIPSSAIWTEDLMWGAGGYDVDRDLYPEAEEMVGYLHERASSF
jgi:alpha-glucosidase (family GH31 glycosyl hydrolase)